MREFTQKFVKYDADFEYGAELPEIFLKCVHVCVYVAILCGQLSTNNLAPGPL